MSLVVGRLRRQWAREPSNNEEDLNEQETLLFKDLLNLIFAVEGKIRSSNNFQMNQTMPI